MTETPLIHIASLVIRARPEAVPTVTRLIESWSEAEIAASDPAGRLVVVLETDLEARIFDVIDTLTPQVLAVNLVYHQIESAETLDEEINP